MIETRETIQPVVISLFKRELTISGHLFRYLRREADNRGISPSETARVLILGHLDLTDERQLEPVLKAKSKSYRMCADEMTINILANALTIIELNKNRSKLPCKRNHQ
jgi:hypothetical protein